MNFSGGILFVALGAMSSCTAFLWSSMSESSVSNSRHRILPNPIVAIRGDQLASCSNLLTLISRSPAISTASALPYGASKLAISS